MNTEKETLEKKERLSSSVIFGILSFIFAQLDGHFFVGAVLGIIGIIKSFKEKKEKQLSLSLSIIGLSLSIINILMSFITIILVALSYLFYFILMILSLA